MTQIDSPTSPSTSPSPAVTPHVAGLRPIRGLRLRELLVLILLRHPGPMTVAALIAAVHEQGFYIKGREGKVVSDQLRYELARGRACRVGRGVYAAGTVTRQARWRMQRRIIALRCTDAVDSSSATDSLSL